MWLYILYSEKLGKYYIGQTEQSPEERLAMHNETYYDGSFTSTGIPWTLHFAFPCESKTQLLKIEKHVKQMKSNIYLENLKKYPEMVQKLLGRFR